MVREHYLFTRVQRCLNFTMSLVKVRNARMRIANVQGGLVEGKNKDVH